MLTIDWDTTIFFGEHEFALCTNVDIDRDLDLLVTGACIELEEDMFYIRIDILNGEGHYRDE